MTLGTHKHMQNVFCSSAASGCSRDLLPSCRTSLKLAESVNQENDGHEEEQVQRGADHRVHPPSRGRMPVKELCRKGGFSDATFYKWRAKYGGMDVPDAKRLRELESENAKLKKLLAEAHLDIHALKGVFGVKR
jgi:putative transposase